MHIVIPMSGTGERFIKAGYDRPKPLILVDGRPIIEYVVSMFAPGDKYTFICNSDHLQNTDMEAILKEIIASKITGPAEIVSISAHKKGPVYAVQQCFDKIDNDEEVIVNYCDFFSYWDYQDFLADTRGRKAAGAIPSYRGFHPHMLGTDNYAFIKDHDRWLDAIQEKKPFTDNRMAEFASNGTYYFSRGEYVKKYFDSLIAKNDQLNGEFYVSMVYNAMVQDGLPVSVYEVQHMLQWGTPRDLEEYQHWSNYFARLAQPKNDLAPAASATVDICLIPAAGKGQRFAEVGYKLPKPLIPVSGKPMVVQATENLPPAERYIFVVQKEHLESSNLKAVLQESFAHTSVVSLDGITEGQAISCEEGLTRAIPPADPDASLLIGACDNGVVFDPAIWAALMADKSIDAAAFSFRHHPSSQRNPQMYGWLITDEAGGTFPTVTGVSVKKAISSTPGEDHAVVGAFFFRKTVIFSEALKILKKENIRVNNEFYVDSMMGVLQGMGKRCVVFEVDDYICFGTPNDLKVFEYWQSFFHKCDWHEYSIDRDIQANAGDADLRNRVTRTEKVCQKN